MMANDNDNIQAYHVRGKVSKVRFVTPASYADGSVFAVTGTWDEEQDNTLSLHQIFRTLQPFPTSQFNPFRTKSVTDVKHEGEVRDLHFLSHDLFLTASSLGRINLFRIAESDPKTQSDTTHKIKLEYSNTTHGSETGRPLAATGIAVEPNNDMNPEIASVGEDGRLVCFRIEENQNDIAVAIYLQEQIDAAVINGISWPTSKEIIVVTSGGQLKKFDRRDLRKSAAVAVDQDYAADSLTAVACNPSQITQIAVGSSSGLVTVWDSKNLSKPLKQFQVHRANVWEVMFHPNRAGYILTGSEDGSVSFINLSGALTDLSDVHTQTRRSFSKATSMLNPLGINSIDYHPIAKLFIAGGDNEKILLSDLN